VFNITQNRMRCKHFNIPHTVARNKLDALVQIKWLHTLSFGKSIQNISDFFLVIVKCILILVGFPSIVN